MLVIAMLFTTFTIPALAETLPVFTIEDASVTEGDVFSVNVTLTENSSICGGGFNIIYDNAKLEIINTSVGDIIRAHTGMVKKDYAENKIRVTWAGITPITLSGTVCTLEFKALSGGGTTSLSFENINAYDYDSKAMNIDTLNGTVSIEKRESKPTISISSSDAVAGSNAVASVNYASNGKGIYGGTFEIAYDSNQLKADAITDIGILGETSYVTNLNYAVNKVKVSFASSEPITDGKLCEISFKVKDSASGNTSLSATGYDFYDVDLSNVNIESKGTTFNITALTDYSKPIISVETTEVGKDENATVYVAIEKASSVYGGAFDILYDKDLFKVISAEKAGELSDDNVVINTTYADGAIRVSWASNSPISKDGNIIKVVFKPLDYSQNSSEIKLNNTELYDAQSDILVHTSTNGIVKFVNKEIKVSEIVITDSMGTPLDTLQPGEININTSISNNSGVAISPIMYVALYDNGKLSEVNRYSLPEAIGNEAVGTYNVTASVPENINEKSLKVLIWRGSPSMNPLTKPVELVTSGSYISMDMKADDYIQDLKAYVVTEEVPQITGKVFSTQNVEKIEYTIRDEYDNLLLSGSATPGKEFSLSPIGFIVGKNILTVKVTEKNGDTIEKSVRIYNTNEKNMQSLDNSDDDGDKLVNCLEVSYGTDKNMADSDSDGLNDYDEIYVFSTNPLVKDSDGDGISDADEDFDFDGIGNLAELTSNTNPLSVDTDNDGLTDYDEINTYNTLAYDDDTDGDDVCDGMEVEYGTDPTVAQTSFSVQYTEENNENVKAVVNVDLDSDQIKTLSVNPVENDPLLNEEIPGYMGSAYDFSVEGEFASATIGFEYDETVLDENAVPTVYYFNEELQLLEELETTVENGVAYAEVGHFSKYILLNKTAFDSVWEEEIKAPQVSEENSNLDIVLVIDSSGSMIDNDPSDLRLSVAKEFVSKLSDNDRAAIVDFDTSATVYSYFSSSKTDLNFAIDRIDSSGGTNLAAGIRSAIDLFSSESYINNSALKYIVMLTDGNGSYSTSLTTEAKEKDIVIYTIGLGSGVKESVLTPIAAGTGGKYYFASAAEDLEDIFVEIGGETIDYSTDSSEDGISDGICDYYNNLIFTGKLKTGTGVSFIGYDFKKKSDYDGDGLLNGEELKIVQHNNRVYMTMISDPTRPDSDGDGLGDNIEIKMFKTDPLMLSILKDYVHNFTYANEFMAPLFKEEVQESFSKKLAIVGGNYLFGSEYDQVAIYKEALIEMFSEIQSEQEEGFKLEKAANVVFAIADSAKNITRTLIGKNLAEIDVLTDEYNALLKAHEDLQSINNYQGLMNIADPIIETHNELCKKYGNVIDEDIEIPMDPDNVIKSSPLHKVSLVLNYAEDVALAWNFIDSYSDLAANTESILNNINILDNIISYSADLALVQAALEIRNAANNELAKVYAPLKDVIVKGTVGKVFSNLSKVTASMMQISKTTKAAFIWAEVAKKIIDIAFGASATTKKALQVIALAKTGEILEVDFRKKVPTNNSQYYDFSDEDMYYFKQLANVRKAGEKIYVDMRKASLMTVVFWNEDYEAAKANYKFTCEKYKTIFDKYSKKTIESNRLQVAE